MRRQWWPRGGAFVPALCALLLAGASPAAAQRFQGDTVEVLSIAFQGARQVPVELLRTAIQTVPTRCVSVALQPLCWLGVSKDRHYLDMRALAADAVRLRIFYYQRGFREARIELDTVRAGSGMHVRFRVTEGQPIVVHTVRVDGAADVDGIARALPIQPGRPFSVVEFESTRDTLTARLANRGFASAYVLANYDIPAGEYQVDVAYQLDRGVPTRFGAIEISGIDRVSRDVVERMLTFRAGDPYSRQALIRSQRNLFGLEVFRHAEITTPRASDTDSVLAVRVQVNEGDLHRVRLGAGVSTTDYVNAEGRWTSRNFLGGGRRLELRGRVTHIVAEPLRFMRPPFESCADIYCDVAGSITADFSQPWLFGPQNSLGAGAFLERFTLPGVYVRSSRGGYASVRRAVTRTGSVTAMYRRELTRLESDGDLIFCAGFIACEDAEIDLLRTAHWLAPLSLGFVLDRSNSIFAPTRGFIVRLEAEHASELTGSQFGFSRVLADVTRYHDPVRGIVVAARLRPGMAWTYGEAPAGLHPQKRFFAGGPNSVRGFAQYRLGPRLLAVPDARVLARPAGGSVPGAGCTAQQISHGSCDVAAFAAAFPGQMRVQPVGGSVSLEGNLEIRYPIWGERLRGATFLDFGQVWRDRGDIDAGSVRFTPGLGVRYFSPIGPIRVDVGYNPGAAERLAVMTTTVCDARATPCGDIRADTDYDASDLGLRRDLRSLQPVVWDPYTSFMDRLQLHFSIGQAF
jgi:outer membrane protein assembly factor BamA